MTIEQIVFTGNVHLVLLKMKIGETIIVSNKNLTFKSLSKNKRSFVFDKQTISFKEDLYKLHGIFISTVEPKRKNNKDKSAILLDAIEADLVVDLINKLNPLHEFSDSYKILS